MKSEYFRKVKTGKNRNIFIKKFSQGTWMRCLNGLMIRSTKENYEITIEVLGIA